jgi:hypothetical protein
VKKSPSQLAEAANTAASSRSEAETIETRYTPNQNRGGSARRSAPLVDLGSHVLRAKAMQEEIGDTAPPAAGDASVFERRRGGREKARIKRLLSAMIEAAIDAARKNGAHAVEIKIAGDETSLRIPLVPDATPVNTPLDEWKAKRAR